MFGCGHTSRVSTGALADRFHDAGPLRGTSTTWPPSSTPVTTPLETLTPPTDPLELALEAVAAKERFARVTGLWRTVVVVGGGRVEVVAVGEVVVGCDGARLVATNSIV